MSNPFDAKVADAQLRLQQLLALCDDNPDSPELHDAADRVQAELADLLWQQAQFAAPYVPSLADQLFY